MSDRIIGIMHEEVGRLMGAEAVGRSTRASDPEDAISAMHFKACLAAVSAGSGTTNSPDLFGKRYIQDSHVVTWEAEGPDRPSSEKPKGILMPRIHSASERMAERGDALGALEFSDLGRNPNFPSGWWILPGAVVGVGLVGAALVGAMRKGRTMMASDEPRTGRALR